MKGFTYGVDEANKRQRVGARYGAEGLTGGLAGTDAYHQAEGGNQLRHTRDGAPCKYWDGHTCSRQEVDGTCPFVLYHMGTGSGGPGVAIATWQERSMYQPERLRHAGSNGGVTNNAAAYAAVAYAAYTARQSAQQQQDPWAAHHRQAGGGGPH